MPRMYLNEAVKKAFETKRNLYRQIGNYSLHSAPCYDSALPLFCFTYEIHKGRSAPKPWSPNVESLIADDWNVNEDPTLREDFFKTKASEKS